nr:hypothetical protein [uncultured Mediterranean phage uvMED]
MPRQLSLFSAEELADCYLQSVVIRKVRQSLRKEKQKKQATTADFEKLLNEDYAEQFGKVVKFPKKFVS